MTEYPTFDEEEARRKKALQTRNVGAPTFRPADVPAEKLTAYSDTDPGPRGDYSDDAALPKFSSPGPGLISESGSVQPAFNTNAVRQRRVSPESSPLHEFNPAQGAQFQSEGDVSSMDRPRFAQPHVTFEDQGDVNKHTAKPTGVIGGGTPLEKTEAQLQEWQQYQPQAKHSRFREGLEAAKKNYLQGGGLIGALIGLFGGIAKPNINSEQSKYEHIGELSSQVKQQLETQRAQGTLNAQSLDQATKLRALNSPLHARHVEKGEDGNLKLVDGDTGRSIDVLDSKGNKVKFQQTAHNGVEYDAPDGSGRLQAWATQNGKRTVRQPQHDLLMGPDGVPISPNTKYSGDAVSGRAQDSEARRIEEKNQESEQHNATLDRNIKDAQSEMSTIDQQIKDFEQSNGGTSGSDYLYVPELKSAREDLVHRRQHLTDDIRGWQKDRKPTVQMKATGKPWSRAAWLKANKGGDVKAAEAEAKRQGATIVE